MTPRHSKLASGTLAITALAASLMACPKASPTSNAADSGTCTAPNAVKDNAGVCVECLMSTDCPTGQFCNTSGVSPVCESCLQSPSSCPSFDAGPMDAGTDAGTVDGGGCTPACAAETCCSGVCTDTMTDPTANCGACGAPACPSVDGGAPTCCAGACSDLQSDPMNCGSCGMACGGSIQCVKGMCQNGYGVLALFDAVGVVTVTPPDGGTPVVTQQEILKPSVQLYSGTLNLSTSTLQTLQMDPCTAVHYDSTTPLPNALNAGPIQITGYDGGAFAATDGGTAPAAIDCALGTSGPYGCGFGPLTNGMPGIAPGEEPFAAMMNPIGTGMIQFQSDGGPSFGSFDVNSAVIAPSGYGVSSDMAHPMGNLSQIVYSSSADTVIPINCPGGTCSSSDYGGFLVVVQATSNSAAHYEEPAVSGGVIVCLGVFGTAFGFSLGPATITIPSSDIATMIGADPTITTFATTVAIMPGSALTGLMSDISMDSEGHRVVALAVPGQFGVSAQQ